MSTSVRAVTSTVSGIASQGGGLRSSVTNSIKSSPVRMISIGPEGGRARVDTSFGNPFSRMRPANPTLNPGGRIFGENGTSRIERPTNPVRGSIYFNRPAPRVGFRPEAASKADIGAPFAKARARNQAQVEARKANDAHAAETFIASALPNVRIPNPNRAIESRGFPNIPQPKELSQEITQVSTERTRSPNIPNFETITRPVAEAPKLNSAEPIKREEKPIAGVPLDGLASKVAKFQESVGNRTEAIKAQAVPEPKPYSQVLREWKTLPLDANSTKRLVRVLGVVEDRRPKDDDKLKISPVIRQESAVKSAPDFQPLPKLTIDHVASFTRLEPLVKEGILTEEQAFQTAGITARPEAAPISVAKPEMDSQTQFKIEGINSRQHEILTSLAPLLQEGDQTIKDRVYVTVGVTPEIAQVVLTQHAERNQRKAGGSEVQTIPQEKTALQQAVQIVRMPDLGIAIGEESESEIQKKAQALIAVIRQTYQLGALGKTETETQQMVERQIASSEMASPKMRLKVSSLLVRLVRQISVEGSTTKKPEEGLHQVDLEKQNRRAKLAISSIDEAPENEKGEISRDYVVGRLQANDNENFWGGLALVLKQRFDGSFTELVTRLKKLEVWADRKSVAKTIDKTMDEFPAVQSALKQTTKLVGVKEVGKVMDPARLEALKSFIKAVITIPQQTLAKAA